MSTKESFPSDSYRLTSTPQEAILSLTSSADSSTAKYCTRKSRSSAAAAICFTRVDLPLPTGPVIPTAEGLGNPPPQKIIEDLDPGRLQWLSLYNAIVFTQLSGVYLGSCLDWSIRRRVLRYTLIPETPWPGVFLMPRQLAPYGSWKSPITAELLASTYVGLDELRIDGDDVYWNELRPADKGRNVIVQRKLDGMLTDVTPLGFSARTRVHEYGGGCYLVQNGTVYFSNYTDQRLYRQDPGSDPKPLTPPVDMRYADGIIDRARNRIISVREDHTVKTGQAVTTIVSLGLDKEGEGKILVSGNDFYSTPRLSPDGSKLASLTWNHPNMPWDGTELWVADVKPDGSLGKSEKVAGGLEESIYQPEWSPDGT